MADTKSIEECLDYGNDAPFKLCLIEIGDILKRNKAMKLRMEAEVYHLLMTHRLTNKVSHSLSVEIVKKIFNIKE